jgi:hypothetical protein
VLGLVVILYRFGVRHQYVREPHRRPLAERIIHLPQPVPFLPLAFQPVDVDRHGRSGGPNYRDKHGIRRIAQQHRVKPFIEGIHRRKERVRDRVEVFVPDGREHLQPDATVFGHITWNVMRPPVNRHFVAAFGEPGSQFLGKCFKPAVICRDTARAHYRDAERLGRGRRVWLYLVLWHTRLRMIDILMSTFNGSQFLAEQLDSILGQTFAEFRLMIRDDASVDDTADILQQFAERDARIEIIEDTGGNLGLRRSFMRLLELSAAEYFMFADQDDVWLPDKIERSFNKIKVLDPKTPSDTPLLVFTDLTVVDERLDTINDSFWKYQALDPHICRDWRDLLAQNVVTGCTILGNAAARQASLPFDCPR